MRLYAVALVTWAATITAFSEPNVVNLSDEKAVDYTEPRDLPEKRTARLHVTGFRVEATSSGDRRPDVGSGGSADERGSNGVSSTPEAIYATPLAETIDEYPFQERSRESGYTVPEEEILLVENAGSFGQRVRHQDHPSDRIVGEGRKDDGYASFRKSFSSTASPLQDEGGRSYVTVTSEPYVFALKTGSDTADAILPSSNDSEVLESKASEEKKSEEIFNSVESATEESSAPTETDVASSILGENDVIPEDPHQMPRARSSRAYNNGTADGVTEGPVEKRVVRVSSSTSVEISPSLQPVKFSGPIVVADLAGRETPETMVDYPDDGDDASSGASSFRSVENGEITPGSYAEDSRSSILSKDSGIATSSIMLNPLQVGIALVNAAETGSDDSEQSAATDTKDYVQEYLQDDLQRLSTVDKKFVESDVENRSRVDYKDEGLQEREGEKSSVEAVAQKVPDNSVEIQKSVEIYHTAPVHEIHYPPVYIQQTSNLGVIETNNIGRSNQLYGQDEQSRSNYDVYRGNEQNVERSVVKAHAPEQRLTRYNALEDDALGKPMTSALIAEYASSSDDVREQAPVESQPYKYNDVRPVLLVPNQFDDTLYEQSDVRHSFKDNAHAAKVLTYGGIARQESASETYRSSEQQQQQQQPINDHQFRAPEMRRPETTQLLLKIIPEGSSANDGFVVPIPRPYPTIEKIVEKTVHVPHPIEIEKVIERKVPFPVERVVEKRVQVPVAVPQLYPVHVQAPMVEKQMIRVPNVYPIHVIERRVPYAVQRLLVQPVPYPSQLQLRLPAAPSADKPVTAGLTAGLQAARLAAGVSFRPYRADAERPAVDSGGSIDSSSKLNDIPGKYRYKTRGREPILEKPAANLRDSAAFEPHNEANASRFYGSIPPYGRPLMYDYNIDNVGKGYVPFTDVKLMILPRKYSSHVVLRPQQAVPVRQQIVYNLVERDKDDEYLGPAPPRKISQSKSPPSATTATLRRSRHPETQYPGSFRQSKMEYGFKPPMVPSVQYDELTATQVEN